MPLLIRTLMPPRSGLLLFLTFLMWGGFAYNAAAQQEPPIYKGLRISLFGFEVIKSKPESISLRYRVANTGRLPVSIGKRKEKSPESLVIELDTVGLPVILQGREYLVSDAVRDEKLSLGPGEMLDDRKLEIKLNKKQPDRHSEPVAKIPGKGCADLVFDTVLITEYTETSMRLRFVIRNAGDAPAELLGETGADEDNLAVNVYFVSGSKLTRGAILADGIFVRRGVETLDGVLPAGQTLQGELNISLKNRTQFIPNLLFELDPFLKVKDCDRTNNTRAVRVEF